MCFFLILHIVLKNSSIPDGFLEILKWTKHEIFNKFSDKKSDILKKLEDLYKGIEIIYFLRRRQEQ